MRIRLISNPTQFQPGYHPKPTYLLLESHNLEAIEVGQVLPPLSALGLLGVVALSPLAVDLVSLPELGDRAGASRTGQLGDDEGGQGGVGESEDMTGDDLLVVGGGAVNQDLISRYLSTSQVPMPTRQKQSHFPSWKIPGKRTRLWSTISTIAASLPV